MSTKKILIVTGPTGVGKTDFVLKLAAKYPAEIINADIGQMYTPLTIGTAKPDWQNEPVPHHLFDVLDSPQDFSIIQFRKLVTKLVPEIWARGKTPIIVGGSTLYIKSLFFAPVSHNLSNQSENKLVTKLQAQEGCDLWQSLNLIDPVRANQLHPNDHYRIQRALDIWHDTGVLPSECALKYAPVFKNMQLFILNAPKKALYTKIDTRVHVMMEMGWLAEVQNLPINWHDFLKRKKIIGYETILAYLEQQIKTKQACVELIQKRVRNYAKKQQTFWRGLQKDLLQQADMHKNIFELDLTLLDVDLYLKQLLDELK